MIKNHIDMYMHCPRCLDERPDDVTPRDWARLNVGMTKEGMQVWCVRHDMNVMAFDFLGQKVRANFDQETPKRRFDSTSARAPRQRKLRSRRPKRTLQRSTQY
jgi:hypothetical protein